MDPTTKFRPADRVAPAAWGRGPRPLALRTLLTIGLPALAALLLPGGILVALLAGAIRQRRILARARRRMAEHA